MSTLFSNKILQNKERMKKSVRDILSSGTNSATKLAGFALSPAFAGTQKERTQCALFFICYFVVLPKPPFRNASASSSSTMPKGRKMPCI